LRRAFDLSVIAREINNKAWAQMNLTDHFTVEELTASQTASRLNIDNTPSQDIVGELTRLAAFLETIKALLGGVPIIVSSGYRSVALNTQIGGARDSQHCLGRAADILAPTFGSPLDVCRKIADSDLPFDQLIQEGTWTHVSIPAADVEPRKDVLTAHFGGNVSYSHGLG
jgi:zinc D-Ala-D-Ala carboxypeptidase